MESWRYEAPWGHTLLERLAGGLSLRANRWLVLVLTFLCYAAYHASRKPPSIVKSVLRESWAPFDEGSSGNSLLGMLDLAFLASYALAMFVAGHVGDRVDLRYFLAGGMLGSGIFVCAMGAGFFWQVHSLRYYLLVSALGGLMQATGWPSVVSVMANWFGKGRRGLVMGLWNAHTSIGNIVGSLAAAAALKSGWGWSFVLPGGLLLAAAFLVFSFLVVEPQDVGFLPQSGSVAASLAPSGSATPRSASSEDALPPLESGAEADDAQRYLARHLDGAGAGLERRPGGLGASLNPQSLAKLAAHHSVRGTQPRHGLFGMGSTLVMLPPPEASLRGLGGLEPPGAPSVKASGLCAAWSIPGVAVYAFTLFFAKLVAYTFLYWLPFYISETDVGGGRLTPTQAGRLSILFDLGGVAGGAVAGYLSDLSGASAVVSSCFVWLTIPMLYCYRHFGSASFGANVGLMMAAGFFVNGPYALITTAVSADLGTSLTGNEKVLATVTAIIDGMGSVGAAIGPMLTGYISEMPGGFDNVFAMLYVSAACAGILLVKLLVKETRDLMGRSHQYVAVPEDAERTTPAPTIPVVEETLGSIAAVDAFKYLPPGNSAGRAERTMDNETGKFI